MVEIGGRPILWHILTHYAAHGFDEFVVALGYKGDVVKRFFLEYCRGDRRAVRGPGPRPGHPHDRAGEDWNVHLVDTGLATNTGGRVKRLADWVGGGTFLLTYGDGRRRRGPAGPARLPPRAGTIATVTAVRPPARFGGLVFDGDLVAEFTEKPQIGEGWINGGFFVFEPAVLDYLDGDETSLEHDALERLAAAGQLAAYRHGGFWQCMDTLRDKRLLEALWQSGRAPWAVPPARPRRSARPAQPPARTAK